VADGTYMKVNFVALQDAVTDLGRGVSALDTKLADLDREARPMVTTWTGDAQAAYNQRQVAWTKAATELKGVLQSIQKALADSLAEYAATEGNIKKSFT
jgi:6 kDa early secretory antigenic target